MNRKSMMIIAVMIFLSAGLYAQGPHGMKKQNMHRGHMNIPDLSDDQKEKIGGSRGALRGSQCRRFQRVAAKRRSDAVCCRG